MKVKKDRKSKIERIPEIRDPCDEGEEGRKVPNSATSYFLLRSPSRSYKTRDALRIVKEGKRKAGNGSLEEEEKFLYVSL